MSSYSKSKLKAARDAIQKKDWTTAKSAASQVLEYEAENYNALVFLGLACLELGEVDDAVKTYERAINIQPANPLAQQGLSKLYERTCNYAAHRTSLLQLIKLFTASGDAQRCAESLQRLLELSRERGTRKDVIDTLSLLLPTSQCYATLCDLPHPEPTAPTASTVHQIQLALASSLPTLEEVVRLSENEEEEHVKKEVDKRRMRLGAGSVDEIHRTVRREVGEGSRLPELYGEVLNHPNASDDLRRETERKLFRLKLAALEFASKEEKGKLRDVLIEMARGQVLLGIPDELAWSVWVEWRDAGALEDYDWALLRRWRTIFPDSALGTVVKGYFLYMGIQLLEEEEEEEENGHAQEDEEDGYDILLEAAESCQNSILTHRMLAEVQRLQEDWPGLIRTSEAGLALVQRHEKQTGQSLHLVNRSLNTELATGLVHLHPPKHHPRALRLLDQVLSEDPNLVPALMGRGYIFQALGKWGEAAIVFGKVVGTEHSKREEGKKAPEKVEESEDADQPIEVVELEAREERAWCWVRNGLDEKGESGLRDSVSLWDISPHTGIQRQRARAWWRLGRCLWEVGGRYEEAYKAFITSLKRLTSFAPAFTSLGIYYSDVAQPPDPQRASKCFQKAFELDAREGDAARRLAEGFAEEGEWDLTEVVARRTIEGEGGLEQGESLVQGAVAARRHLPQNAWAWKALGAVELQRRSFAPAIQAFQIALRAEPDDAGSWLRLGEAYARSGRQVAAIKALNRAQQLDSDNWVCAFLLAEVECEIGRFDAAIAVFEDISQKRPDDAGVLSALGSAYLAYGRAQVIGGYLGRSEGSFWQALEVARRLLAGESNFRRLGWKTLCDALFELGICTSFEHTEEAYHVLREIESMLLGNEVGKGAILGSLLTTASVTKTLGEGTDGLVALKLSLLGCEHRVALTKFDNTGLSSAWFDLATGLHKLVSLLPITDNAEPYLKESLRCCKEAVKADPKDPQYWNALGVMSFEKNARLAQYAFLSAIQIDNKDPLIWTNLGLLYLFHQDTELANQAFLRAQTLDPDEPLAWVGQALLAAQNGDEADASALFEHAVVISSGSMLEASHMFATRLFNARETEQSQLRTDRLFLAFSALDRYCREQPTSSTVLHLHGLICEQLGQTDLAEGRVRDAIVLLEKEYETSEDKAIERRYAVAHSNLGRLLVVNGKYEEAIQAFGTAVNLLQGEAEDGDEEVSILQAQAALSTGLAHFLASDLEQALTVLEAAQEQVPEVYPEIKGHISLTLAKMLWALGSEEARESAKSLLLECISADPHNLAAITALASIGSLTGDTDLLTAALAEIDILPRAERAAVDPSGEVDFLLSRHHLANGDIDLAVAVAEEALSAQPYSLGARQNVARLFLMSGNSLTARDILQREGLPEDAVSRRLSALIDLALKERGELDLEEVEVNGNEGTAEDVPEARKKIDPSDDAQRAVLAAPWDTSNWGTAVLCSKA
ncbi:TPR-like protein [Dacryopinax primogenitus]|uniref:TPR-like protein n=1 Tax=Dacryopinax primogenitus (strain DJM 731) TaxID=1858805 RepID=M5G708_DACPD|nr:TPR-like protein [Dacryopinax primogenitus]EJU03995.1 TPR-like protein [Dacryopinax primogenitus]